MSILERYISAITIGSFIGVGSSMPLGIAAFLYLVLFAKYAGGKQ